CLRRKLRRNRLHHPEVSILPSSKACIIAWWDLPVADESRQLPESPHNQRLSIWALPVADSSALPTVGRRGCRSPTARSRSDPLAASQWPTLIQTSSISAQVQTACVAMCRLAEEFIGPLMVDRHGSS